MTSPNFPEQAVTLLELNRLIGRLVSVPQTQDVWVTAELSDVRVSRGHCYMELLQKDESGANTLAKARAAIWANTFIGLRSRFYAATGRDFTSGIKVMVRVTANYHPIYGMSLIISDVNPDFTMGDLLRRRREIIERLRREGILDFNRNLEWPDVPQRIAVISAPGAAGYGDFIDQLLNNPRRLRFKAHLFPALMQGSEAPASIIAQLEAIGAEQDDWDCVVIIRGGGATSDLEAFEDYNLAANVAAFPLPVIIGIGHERDITVLDSVANMRVKTPTAAAEWLVGRGSDALDRLLAMASAIQRAAADRIGGELQHLSYCEGLLPVVPAAALTRAAGRINELMLELSSISSRRIVPEQTRLDNYAQNLASATANLLLRSAERLNSREKLLEVLSPEATLKRGYSITRIGGHAVTSADDVPDNAVIETVLAHGSILSRKTTEIPQ